MSDTFYSPARLAESISSTRKTSGLPPVHDWHPDFCGDIDIQIKRDGSWHYMGSSIARESMVRLFSTILRHDDDGCFYLVTPVEKVRIQVEDAPFVATQFIQEDNGITFITNVGDAVSLDREHPLVILENGDTREPAPYVRVRDRLDALIHRNVFYQLVALAEACPMDSGVDLQLKSHDAVFSLGRISQDL